MRELQRLGSIARCSSPPPALVTSLFFIFVFVSLWAFKRKYCIFLSALFLFSPYLQTRFFHTMPPCPSTVFICLFICCSVCSSFLSSYLLVHSSLSTVYLCLSVCSSITSFSTAVSSLSRLSFRFHNSITSHTPLRANYSRSRAKNTFERAWL